jgi:hypothetical protein
MQSVFVVTANRTADGRAVYLTADRRWSEVLDDASCTPEKGAQEEALGWAGSQQYDVCDPYLLPVDKTDEGLIAASARERIRASGPLWIAERFGYEI